MKKQIITVMLMMLCFTSATRAQFYRDGRFFQQTRKNYHAHRHPSSASERERNSILQPSKQSLNEGAHHSVGVEEMRLREGRTAPEIQEGIYCREIMQNNFNNPMQIEMTLDQFDKHGVDKVKRYYKVDKSGKLVLWGHFGFTGNDKIRFHSHDEQKGFLISRIIRNMFRGGKASQKDFADLSIIRSMFCRGKAFKVLNHTTVEIKCGLCNGRKIVSNGVSTDHRGERSVTYSQCIRCHGSGKMYAEVEALHLISVRKEDGGER